MFNANQLPPVHPGEHFNFAEDVLDQYASRGLKAMIWTDGNLRRDLSYQYFSDQSKRVAVWMQRLGVTKGQRIVMMLPRLPEWFEIFMGSIRAGVVVIPVTTLLTAKDIGFRLQVSGATMFVCDDVGLAKFREIGHSLRKNVKHCVLVDGKGQKSEKGDFINYNKAIPADSAIPNFKSVQTRSTDPCLSFFTSGTTTVEIPKVDHLFSIEQSHRSSGATFANFGSLRPSLDRKAVATAERRRCLLEHGRAWRKSFNLLDHSNVWQWAKAAWALFGAWTCGAALFIFDDRSAFDPTRMIETLHKYEITNFCAPPTAFRQLILEKSAKLLREKPPKALRVCNSAGEALGGDVITKWRRATGLGIFEGFGQTETTMILGNFADAKIRAGSCGRPAAGITLAIVDAEGNELADENEGNIGVLVASGEEKALPWLFDGYVQSDGSVKRPEVTNKAGQRFYLTGDKAKRDRDGYYWFMSRADDVINTSGYRVGPFEVESVLSEHPSVVECAVVASPDEKRGDIVKAFVVLKDEYRKHDQVKLAKDIETFVAKHTAPYKKPRAIEFVDSLPKTVSGKIRRVELRALEQQRKKSGGKAKL